MKDRGFTLIELLVSVAIISLLASIAIPQFNSYRGKAYEVAALSDLKNAAIALEAYYVDNESYALCAATACNDILPGFTLSNSVGITVGPGAGSTPSNPRYAISTCTLKGNVFAEVGARQFRRSFFLASDIGVVQIFSTISLGNLSASDLCEAYSEGGFFDS